MRTESRYTKEPFTLAVCARCTPEVGDLVITRLQDVVGNCPQAVMLTTACLRGRFGCATTDVNGGVIALLQPCTIDRVPVSPVRWIGPIGNATDTAIVCDWIAAGGWDERDLPPHLHANANFARSSRLN